MDSHMELLSPTPSFDLYNHLWPIKTASYSSPPAKFARDAQGRDPHISNSIISEGCIINGATVINSVLGRNVILESGSVVENSIIHHEVMVGSHAHIHRTIIDKRAKIDKDERIGFDRAADGKKYHVSDTGIVVVPRGQGMAP